MSFSINRSGQQSFIAKPTDPIKGNKAKPASSEETNPIANKTASKIVAKAATDVTDLTPATTAGSAAANVALFDEADFAHGPAPLLTAGRSIVAESNIPTAKPPLKMPLSLEYAPFDAPLLGIQAIEALSDASKILPAEVRSNKAMQKIAEQAVLAFKQSYN